MQYILSVTYGIILGVKHFTRGIGNSLGQYMMIR